MHVLCSVRYFSMMQAAEDAQSTLAERVETLGVSERHETTENEKETGEKTTETTDETKTNEDATGTHF